MKARTGDVRFLYQKLKSPVFGRIPELQRAYPTYIAEDMTQIELARKLGVTQGDLSKMENSNRSVGKEMAHRLAKVFSSDYRVFT